MGYDDLRDTTTPHLMGTWPQHWDRDMIRTSINQVVAAPHYLEPGAYPGRRYLVREVEGIVVRVELGRESDGTWKIIDAYPQIPAP